MVLTVTTDGRLRFEGRFKTKAEWAVADGLLQALAIAMPSAQQEAIWRVKQMVDGNIEPQDLVIDDGE